MTDSFSARAPGNIVTIERHILEEQAYHPEATGIFTSLLYDVALAGKVIASQTTRAGLVEILGRTGTANVQGEDQQKLDVLADTAIYRLNQHTGRIAVMASEEHPDILPIPPDYPPGKYVLLYDPLDGSSNIDYSVPVGTIFAIYHRVTPRGPGTLEDCLQPGNRMVAAGYLIYGSSTMLVYTTGHGVHGFTLDPSIGEFLRSHHNIRIPVTSKYYSVNQGYQKNWSEGVQRFTRYLQGEEGAQTSLSLRYIGSLIADFHRNLLAGGIFYYPADERNPHGKLRLVYEAAPLAFIAEQAGGCATDGTRRILDLTPQTLHERTPLFIGSAALVSKAGEFIAAHG